MTALPSRTHLIGLLVLSTASVSAAAQSILAQHGEIVQAVGDAVIAAPGVTPAPGATIFATNNFDSPFIDQNGTVAYRARFSGGGATAVDDRGIFLGRASGDVRMVVRAGDQAPGQPLGTLMRTATSSAGLVGSGGALRISPFGEILFFATTLHDPVTPANTPTTSDTALYWGQAGALLTLAREGTPVGAAWAGGANWLTNFSAGSSQFNHINASGAVLFTAQIVGGSSTTADDSVLVTGLPGSLVPVSREGQVMAAGGLLVGGESIIPVSGTTMGFTTLLNEAGQVLHEMRFSTTVGPATTADDRALGVWTAGTTVVIARENQQAPGLPTGDLFATATGSWSPGVGSSAFSRSGKTMLQADLAFGTTTTTNNSAIYFGGPGPIAPADLVIRKGTILSNGATFNGAGTSGMACSDTEFAFVGFMTGTATSANDTAIFRGSNAATLSIVAREGDTVPAGVLPGGPWTYGQFSNGTNNPILNYDGALFFQCTITDGTITKTVYLCSLPGIPGLRLMLDAGDQVSTGETFTTILGTGSVGVVSSTAGSSNADGGGQSHFNNQGDVVFKPNLNGGLVNAILRGHLGSFIAKPSSIPTAAGGTQSFVIDCGSGQAGNVYLVLGSSSGTRPGFPSPFGPQQIRLNPDVWFQVTLDLLNTPVFTNTLGLLNAQGQAAASFNLPGGITQLQGLTLHHQVLVLTPSFASTFASEPSAIKIY